MAGVFIEVTGLEQVQQVVKNLNELDMDDLLHEIGAILKDDQIERFANEESPDGTKWQVSKRAEETAGVTMTDSGILRDSFHAQVSGSELLFGTPEVYGAIHQFGGPAGRNRQVSIPQRELIGITSKQLLGIEQATQFYMSKAIL